MKRNRFIIAAALVLLVTEIHAQSMQTIDVKAGASFSTFRYEGDLSTERGTASGMNVALRYTYFFNGRLGAYAQLGASKVDASEAVYFGAANKADGGKYMYRYSNGETYESMLLPSFTSGAAYCFDFGRFNVVPRIGVGLAWKECGIEYERRARDGQTGPEYYSFESVRQYKSIEYLIDGPASAVKTPDFMLSSAVQFTYSFGAEASLFVEPAIEWTPASHKLETCFTPSSRLYEPENWVEAVAYASGANQWQTDYKSGKIENVSVPSAPFFSIDLGLRINLF